MYENVQPEVDPSTVGTIFLGFDSLVLLWKILFRKRQNQTLCGNSRQQVARTKLFSGLSSDL